MKDRFIAAIHARKKIKVVFYSKEDGTFLTRLCAPMDYGPSRRARDGRDRFHAWDYESDTGQHTLPLLPEQIKEITVLEEKFEPAEFITWDVKRSPWFVKRDWGIYS